MTIRPFTITVPQERLDWIARRLDEARWPDVPDSAPWAHGTMLLLS